MVDVHAIDVVLWTVLISCIVATVVAMGGIAWAWLAERARRARDVAGGISAAEDHLAEAARDRSAR